MYRVISASVTPFDAKGNVDAVSAARLYEWGLGCGLDGFFVFGTMGEWAVLTEQMRLTLARVACDVIGDRARLIFGVHDTGLTRILRNMDRLTSFTHTHWTAVLPGGLGKASEPVRYVHAIADHADRPFFLYHNPAQSGAALTSAQFRDILSHPNVTGVKNSAGTMRVRKELLLLKGELDFELYEGEEWAIDEALGLGLDGVICGFGSMGARLIRGIADAVEAKDHPRARELQMELIRVFHVVYGDDTSHWCVGQKYGLHRMGILDSYTCLLDGQQDIPAEARTEIDRCIEANPQWFGPQG